MGLGLESCCRVLIVVLLLETTRRKVESHLDKQSQAEPGHEEIISAKPFSMTQDHSARRHALYMTNMRIGVNALLQFEEVVFQAVMNVLHPQLLAQLSTSNMHIRS